MSILIDKTRLCVNRGDLKEFNVTDTKLQFNIDKHYDRHSASTFSKRGNRFINLTPTKQKRNGRTPSNNMQMPSEGEFFSGLSDIIPPKPLQKLVTLTELHLTKDINLDTIPPEHLEMLAGLKYKRLVVVEHSSDENYGTLCLAPSKHNIKDKDYTGSLLFKFYWKNKEYEDKHHGQVLDVENPNILRIEIQLQKARQLDKVNKFLTGETGKRLLLSTLLEKLERNELYVTLDEVFKWLLKEYVFNRELESADSTKHNSVRCNAIDLLANSKDLHEYRIIFEELGMSKNFKESACEARKIIPDNYLYQELYEKIFNESTPPSCAPIETEFESHKDTEDEASFVSRVPKVYGLNIRTRAYAKSMKQYTLIYPVPIWDDS